MDDFDRGPKKLKIAIGNYDVSYSLVVDIYGVEVIRQRRFPPVFWEPVFGFDWRKHDQFV
jgi:hypothetical protein